MIKCEKCLYRKNCQFLKTHKKTTVEGCTAFESESRLKAEAVKEFAEAYKDQIEDCTGMFTVEGFYVPLDAVLNAVDFIRERLVGDTDV